ncbi:MAG: hypothetical protein WCG23_09855 [bacterium]
MNAVDSFFSIVVVDYKFEDVNTFREKIKTLSLYNEYSLNESRLILESKPYNSILEQQAQLIMPLIVFDSNQKIQIIFNAEIKALEIKVAEYSKEKNSKIISIANKLLGLKISDISQIGFNFFNIFNTKEKRLNLFNLEIENKLKDWDRNQGFVANIPLLYEDYLATYSIAKIKSSTHKDFNNIDHFYQISSNFNFEFKEEEPQDRINQLKRIFDKTDFYSDQFNKTCGEILSL